MQGANLLTNSVAYRGFLAPGAEMGIGAPLLRRARLASAKTLSIAMGGVLGLSPSHQRFLDFGAIGSKWSPFLNNVNTIFNFSCQTEAPKAFCRSPLLLGVWGGAPAANAFGSIWVLEPIFE